MKVLICGTREAVGYEDELERIVFRDCWPVEEFIHGACKNSPDMYAERWQNMPGVKVTPYPADWDKYGKSAGYVRNTEMANLGRPGICLAVWDGKSKGTLNMIQECVTRGIPVRIIPAKILPHES